MFTYIRNSYYAQNLRRSIKWYKRNCVICRREDGKPVSQLMGNLNKENLDISPPFITPA